MTCPSKRYVYFCTQSDAANYRSAFQLSSLRTTLATNTCLLYSELAQALGSALDPFCEAILGKLFGMSGSTKKIVVSHTQSTADTVLACTSPQPKVITQLVSTGLQEKIALARQYAVSHLKFYLETHGQRAKHAFESSGSVDTIEKGLKKALLDPNPAVREAARPTFWVFDGIWKERGAVLISGLDSTARRLLEAACPEPGKTTTVPSTPNQKKSNVRAAIAASRAKAKALATAPPTLRHAATSVPQRNGDALPSPTFATAASPTPSVKSATIRRPLSRPLSPSSPTRRVASFSPLSSSTSVPAIPVHDRRASETGTLSQSQSLSAIAHRRVASQQTNPPSSPTGSSSTLDMALKTALPASPRRSLDMAVPPSPTRFPTGPSARMPSPTRIPSPTRRPNVRKSLTAALVPANDHYDAFTLPKGFNGLNDSLLMAQKIPLPDDSDSDDDSRMMLSFSAPYEKYHSVPLTTNSSVSMGSPPPSASVPIVEDALRARAEQAESAAERLLELVEPDDDAHVSPIPPSLLPTNGTATTTHRTPLASKTWSNNVAPVTPMNKKPTFSKHTALLQNSPAYKAAPSLVDVLKERKHETSWWLKRLSCMSLLSLFISRSLRQHSYQQRQPYKA